MGAQPRTVVFLLESMSGGGAERNALALLRHLPPAEWRQVLVLKRRGGALLEELPPGQEVQVLEEMGARGHLGMARCLAQVLRTSQADLLFTSLFRPNALGGLAKALHGSRVPWIPSEHNNLQRILASQPTWNRLKRYLVFRWLYPRAAKVVAVSSGLGDSLHTEFGLPRPWLQTIHNPIDCREIENLVQARSGHARPAGPPRIVACGRLIHQKGFDLLLEAVAGLDLPQAPELVIVGEGARRPELEQQARALGIADRVRFTGFLLSPWEELALGDVFVLSSRWEGFGNVLIEAMACGLPVVAFDCDFGPREILTDGVNGLLVPPEDPQALGRAIARVLQDPTLATGLAGKGRQRARDFSAPAIVAQYAALFEQVIHEAESRQGAH